MSAFNGAGTFVISGVGLPFVTGTTISSTVANQLNADLATGLSTCITKDGQSVPVANIPMGNFKLTGLAAPTAPGDALSYGNPATVSTLNATGAITSGGNISAGANSAFLVASAGGNTSVQGGQVSISSSGINALYSGRGFSNNDYIDVSANGNTVRLAAPGGGGGNWTVVSERAKKKDLVPLPGDPFAIISSHSVEVGHYLTEDAAAPLHAFLFYEDAVINYPWATVTMPARSVPWSFTDPVTGVVTSGVRDDPEYKGLSLEAYVPLLMAALQKQIAINASLDARLVAGGL